ncbi:MAG: AAA family ATPase, partial [Oscillospiraceae bacterium]|nr:AAA family ATPase [Oscillospiraceae bacterium]
MYIRSIELTNFRCFEKERIEFDPQLTVLIGDNGCGKSSVLTALSIAAGSFFLGFDNIPSGSISQGDVRNKTYLSGSLVLREPQFPAQISCTGSFDGATELSWSRELNGEN